MNYLIRSRIIAFAVLLCVAHSALGQKVKVGYDKSVDFTRFTTYSWAQPTSTPSQPLLWASIASHVDAALQSKGLTKAAGDADLILIPEGGVEYGLLSGGGSPPISPNFNGPPPAMNATMWTGAAGPSTMGTYVGTGTLVLTFVDRNLNKVIWTGTVTQKLDTQNKKKSLETIHNAVAKLLVQYPPKR